MGPRYLGSAFVRARAVAYCCDAVFAGLFKLTNGPVCAAAAISFHEDYCAGIWRALLLMYRFSNAAGTFFWLISYKFKLNGYVSVSCCFVILGGYAEADYTFVF